jgi:hypothetical protein
MGLVWDLGHKRVLVHDLVPTAHMAVNLVFGDVYWTSLILQGSFLSLYEEFLTFDFVAAIPDTSLIDRNTTCLE